MSRLDPGHGALRGVLRVIGPLIIIAGIMLIAVALLSFFQVFTSVASGGHSIHVGPGGPGPLDSLRDINGGSDFPQYFWCGFVGMPLLAIGIGITRFAYMGAVARYVAEEMAPVATDTLNYVAEESEDGIRTVARAISEGINGHSSQEAGEVPCAKCGSENDADSRFCKQCGATLDKTCRACGKRNDADAKFCKDCGEAIE